MGRLTALACVLILLAPLGCGRETGTGVPAALLNVPPRLIGQHGKLYFVQDPAAGYRAAAENSMPCMLFFTAEWCTYCHHMEETAFTDNTVRLLADGFVCILVDADRQPALCRELGVSGFPTIQFIAADGRMLHRLVGRQSAASLATAMRTATNRHAWLLGEPTTVR